MFKKSIAKYIKVIKSEYNPVLWFSICRSLKTICCLIYIPSEGSPYSNLDIFDNIEKDLSEIKIPDYRVCIFGDTNARTGQLNNFFNTDKYIPGTLNVQIHNITIEPYKFPRRP